MGTLSNVNRILAIIDYCVKVSQYVLKHNFYIYRNAFFLCVTINIKIMKGSEISVGHWDIQRISIYHIQV